jgi:hypothetical protein
LLPSTGTFSASAWLAASAEADCPGVVVSTMAFTPSPLKPVTMLVRSLSVEVIFASLTFSLCSPA